MLLTKIAFVNFLKKKKERDIGWPLSNVGFFRERSFLLDLQTKDCSVILSVI